MTTVSTFSNFSGSFFLQWHMDVEKEEEAEPQGGWEWVKTQEEKIKKEREQVCVALY